MKKTILSALAVSLVAVGVSQGATTFSGTFTFTGATGNVESFVYNGDAIPGLSISNIVKVGAQSSSGSNGFRANNWEESSTVSKDHYIEFTITADSGVTFDIKSISFSIYRSATGPNSWQWGSSESGIGSEGEFAAITTYEQTSSNLTLSGGVLTTGTSATTANGNILDLANEDHEGLSSVTLRLYGYGSSGTAGSGGLQGPLTFTGTLIPEPSTALLGAVGLLGLLRRRR